MANDPVDLITKITIVGCVYELVALTTRRVPTITYIIRWIGKRRWGRAIAWLWVGYVTDHFLLRDDT